MILQNKIIICGPQNLDLCDHKIHDKNVEPYSLMTIQIPMIWWW